MGDVIPGLVVLGSTKQTECWELLRQLYCLDLQIGPLPPHQEEKGVTNAPFREQPQNVPALSQGQMS